ncbi:hypothetical protein LWI29_012095 [Acer saccharum]|uniref:Apple domain-containing protein n=1 Tax=Acer saccharum TaxID=4024 RepID=A0AA39SPV9_ACESA|nr:hypothetical protein LWI29_012095 [Acer saccharum]
MCRTSGIWLNGDFNYSDSWGVNNYNFSYTSNEQETYFSYSTNEDSKSFPILTIDLDGNLTYNGGDMSYGVCPIFEKEVTPICRKVVVDFNLKYGFMFGDGFMFKESDNMTSIDCQLKCQNNCSCFAYATTNRENDTGCEIWSRGTKFIEAYKDFDQSKGETGSFSDESVQKGGVEATVEGKKKGRKKIVSSRTHGMQTHNTKKRETVALTLSKDLKVHTVMNKGMWDFDDEIAKVIEIAVALGFKFNGNKKEIRAEQARRENEDDDRFAS